MKFDFPIVEAIKSILPICDEFVVAVGKSEDDTLGLIQSIGSPKIKIIETVWDESLRQGGRVLADETNKAYQAISEDIDWCFYIQGDEVMHERDLPTIQAAMLKYKDDSRVQGLVFDHLNFYGSYDYIADSRDWHKGEMRVVRKAKNTSCEEMIQQRFNDKAPNWSEYNATNPDTPLPYKAVVLFDVPEQISEKSLWFLGRICENGPRCGVLPIIAIDSKRVEDRRYEKFRATLEAASTQLDHLLQCAGVAELSFTYMPEKWPHRDVLDGYMARLAENCAANTRFRKTMPDLWTNLINAGTTIGGFDISIGWTPAGDFATLRMVATDPEHHGLLAGKTGSGKSNLLHVLIHTLCEKYPPEELDLYLLDYKESTEFNV